MSVAFKVWAVMEGVTYDGSGITSLHASEEGAYETLQGIRKRRANQHMVVDHSAPFVGFDQGDYSCWVEEVEVFE